MIPKFRAWNKDDKEMIDVRVIDWNNMTVDSFSPYIEIPLENVIIMQSTGLKDKNGQEIFEGDIVQFFDSIYTVFYDIKEGSYRLEPHDDRWVVDYMSNFSSEESFEVVGNIYENKEYL
nr:MAG TPA: YopX protein [Caudoviricetes sp.]